MDELVERARSQLHDTGPGRRILGIAGAPASGKSTLASKLTNRLKNEAPGQVELLGMDGFHLAHQILVRRGQVDIKGAPETFDASGFIATLQRIRQTADTVYAPRFERKQEDSIAQAVEIGPEVKLIITEGNYLLLDAEPWSGVRPLLDEAWFVELAEPIRQSRLLQRHLSFGHDQDAARSRTYGSDQRNAELINSAVVTPDVWVTHRTSGNHHVG
jgi:pantothenate kinase